MIYQEILVIKYLTGDFVSEEIRYLDPELNGDSQFETIRWRGARPGTITKILLRIVYLTFVLDAAALIFVYIYPRV